MVGQSPELDNWEENPIRYGVGLLDASRTMLTPSIERTEKNLQAATIIQTEQNMAPFQELRIKE